MINMPLMLIGIYLTFVLSYFYFLYKLCKDIKMIENLEDFFTYNFKISKMAGDIFTGRIKERDIRNSKYFNIVKHHLRLAPVIFVVWLLLDAWLKA